MRAAGTWSCPRSRQDQLRLQYAAFLPWRDVLDITEPYLRNPNPELRAASMQTLTYAARYHRDRLAELLAFIRARRNEQDPVRQAMLSGLAGLPPGIWREEHLDDLGAIVRDALYASDLSSATAASAERLAVPLLPFHPEWAIGWIETLVRERGHVSFPKLEDRLTDADVRRLVPRLLKEDSSAIMLREVVDYLHRQRQNLLMPFLSGPRVRGRFATGNTRYVLPFNGGFYRWTAAQQEVFAQTLRVVIDDAERDSPAIFSAIEQLSALQAVPPVRLVQLADVDNARVAVRDAAQRALGRLDGGQGVEPLLEAMSDDRARVAIYALRRAVLDMPESRALPLLQGVPMERVTVAKEVVRLIGELRGDDAYNYLLVLDRQELHRDVRVALLRAFWDYLEREETWPILERAARSSDPAMARGVIRIPADRISSEAQRRLASLLATLLEHPEPQVRTEALQRLRVLPITDTERVLLPRLMETLTSSLPDERRGAAGAVFATYAGRDAELVGQTVARIRNDRRVLRTLVTALKGQLSYNRTHLIDTVRAVIAALEPDPLTVTLRIELAVDALPWEELASMLTRLAESGGLHCEALMTVVQGVEAVARHRLSGPARLTDAQEVGVLESVLASSQDEKLRRIALAALVALGNSPTGWTGERLERLRTYRADPSPLVASAAQFMLPSEEQG